VKARLAMLENRRKPDDSQDGRPRLRRKPGSGDSPDGDSTKPDQDDRPTLKRRD